MRSRSASWALVASLVACGAPAKRAEDRGAGPALVQADGTVLGQVTTPLHALIVRGDLTLRREGSTAWEALAATASTTGVRELKADRRGAVIALGPGADAPRLYLRGGTRVELGESSDGIRVIVRAGRARLRRGTGPALFAVTSGAMVAVTGDVIVDAGAATAAEVVPTGARVDAAAFSLDLEGEGSADGGGIGRMEAPAPNQRDRMEPVELVRVAVEVTTAGDLAVTEVTHSFHSSASERREATFRFPVPDGAMLVGLAMEIGGTLMEGEIVEREKARAVYDQIVDHMLDPALLEWEAGNWFKLRVFPLEPGEDKRVVLRYVTPLVHTASGWQYESALTAPAGGEIGALTVTVNGTRAISTQHVTDGLDVAVAIPQARIPAVMREVRDDGVYTAVRIRPSLPAAGVAGPGVAGRKIAVVVDTSRSSLEGRAQALEVLGQTLGELASTDQFIVLASDVAAVPAAPDYQPATAAAIAAATAFIIGIEPDGATDLGAAFTALDARDPTAVIYIGDGIATWGEQRPTQLAALATAVRAPISAALVGKGASRALWSEVAGATGGRALLVKCHADAAQFALAATAREVPRLLNARVSGPDGASVFPTTAARLVAGEVLVAVLNTPRGAPPPTTIRLTGTIGGEPYVQDVSLVVATATARVAQRWARHELARLEVAEAPREEIVKLSTAMGVLSMHTSLLVLESDEMYKQFQIERKQAAAQAAALPLAQATAPTVTGGDLDTLGARNASLSPDEIQPGDPEIKVPAPADARSVVVTFPFGETKLAVWDDEIQAWMVRFLIDLATPDGVYYVRVTVTRADGTIESLQLPYTVDTKAPLATITARPDGAGYWLRVKQRREPSRGADLDRAEVTLPDGTVMELTQIEWGVFEGRWTPALPLTAPVTLKVVVRDNALNQAVQQVTVGGAP